MVSGQSFVSQRLVYWCVGGRMFEYVPILAASILLRSAGSREQLNQLPFFCRVTNLFVLVARARFLSA